MEEFVGKHWHRFITHRANKNYPEACVQLESIKTPLGITFRAFGGDGGLKIETAMPNKHGARRTLLQRIAGSQRKVTLAWRDTETLRLPALLDIYPDRQLNQDLYYWLAALAAVSSEVEQDWFVENQRGTQHVLKRFPGLHQRYHRLVAAELTRRPDTSALPRDEAAQELAIQNALRAPGSMESFPMATRPVQPVYLWLYPVPPGHDNSDSHRQTSDPDDADPCGEIKQAAQQHRYRAEQAEMPDDKDGLITMRWENIFSWGEYIKLNRASDDDEDDNAAETARDMDVLSVAQDQQSSATRLRLDLDLPSVEYDDIPLGAEITLPEWHWRKQKLLPDHCCIQAMIPRHSTPRPLPEELQGTARKLRGQFSALAQNRNWLHSQQDGCELDMAAYLDHFIARKTQGPSEEPKLYRDLRINHRDLATLLLADLSLSTDAALDDTKRIIDVIRDSLLLFSEALAACGDRYAIYGFSSRRREQVRFHHLKQFEEPHSDNIRGRLQAIKPGYYTRMGAAIRHATDILATQAASRRLLLILTDGKPNDLDCYEGRYGVEDTRMAIREARQQGLTPFCITIDREADNYLPYLFGCNGYILIRQPKELPEKLITLHAQLTSNA